MRRRPTPKKRRLALELFQRAVAKGEKTKTGIYQDLAETFNVESRTIQRWIYGGRKSRYAIEALRDEAYAKCRKGDHSWFGDSRFDGLAYRCESFYELNDFGGIRTDHSTKICYFCGYTQTGLIF
jgi:hypothetical protein